MKFLKSTLIFLVCLTFVTPAFSQTRDVRNVFVNIADKLIPSVVNISIVIRERPQRANPFYGDDELWRRFGEEFFGAPFGRPPRRQKPREGRGIGSGFVIEKSKNEILIITNNHVIDKADEIKVKFTESSAEDGIEATVVGTDPDLDIALLEVESTRNVKPVRLGDSEKLKVGEWIAAVGNPFGHGHSMSHGIVSAKERTLPGFFAKYLQVDAPINPGNSGGPLVDLNGRVVGINNAIDGRGAGIGFAIPINAVKDILPQLKDKGKVDRGYLGVSVGQLTKPLARSLGISPKTKAPIVTNVLKDGPAMRAGVRPYDVITHIDNKRVRTTNELIAAISSKAVGKAAKVKVLRKGNKKKTITVKLARRPDLRQAGHRGRKPPKRKEPSQKPSIDVGMMVEDIDEDWASDLGVKKNFKGIVVTRVTPFGPAFEAGLRRGDIILEVETKKVKSVEEFFKIVKKEKSYLIRAQRAISPDEKRYLVLSLNLAKKNSN